MCVCVCVSGQVERKGPKKPIREIQLRFPKKKVKSHPRRIRLRITYICVRINISQTAMYLCVGIYMELV